MSTVMDTPVGIGAFDPASFGQTSSPSGVTVIDRVKAEVRSVLEAAEQAHAEMIEVQKTDHSAALSALAGRLGATPRSRSNGPTA